MWRGPRGYHHRLGRAICIALGVLTTWWGQPAFQFSSARRVALGEDPSQPTVQFQIRNLTLNGKQHPRLRMGMQFFYRATVIAFPDSAYCGGIADEYIASFGEWIGKESKTYMTAQREG